MFAKARDAVDLLTSNHYEINKNLKRGYCIVRPPGHHSMCANSAGFCIFNNVGIAA
jgi:acetoin utilization deacetylase AcuC-like enzyme